MSLINSISNTYEGTKSTLMESYEGMSDSDRARELESMLTEICYDIVECTAITKDKHIDIELLLQIV